MRRIVLKENRCIFARITKNEPNIVELMDLILANNCTDLHKTPHKIGRIYIDVMTQYLIEHQQELGINRIELTDNAHYRCPQQRHLSIHLEKSRQLEGDDPYYMQFGYHPKYSGSSRKLINNKQRMLRIKTSDDMGLIQACQFTKCSQKIMDYIHTHQDQSLSKTLKYLGRSDCVTYYEIHQRLFKNLKN